MRLLAGLLLAVSAAPAAAGDYFLLVQRDPRACHDRYASVRAAPEEVAAELLAFFAGREPRIPALPAVVQNGRLGFCTRRDRERFDRSLLEIGLEPRLAREDAYVGFFRLVAHPRLVRELEELLRTGRFETDVRARLERLRAASPSPPRLGEGPEPR